MERKGLSKLKTKIRKNDIYAFDIETFGDNNEFLMGSIVGENVERTFWEREKFIDYLLTSKRFRIGKDARTGVIIFATNLQFDILALFNEAQHFRNMRFTQRGGAMLKAEYLIGDEKIVLMDTMNYIPLSVEKMGKLVGIDKIKDYKFIIGDKDSMLEHSDELKAYNINDCRITEAFANLLQKGFNELGCDMRMTIASTAMNLFQRKYIDKTWFVAPDDIRESINKAYFGGRTEAFYRGIIDAEMDFDKENIFYYDVNSLYPFCMLAFEYPDTNTVRRCKDKSSQFIIDNFEGVSEVEMLCPDDGFVGMYPVLPMKHEDKLLFPKGIIKGTYTHAEIRYAQECGYKMLNIGQCVYFKRTHRPFIGYVEELYRKRMEYKSQKSPLELVAKLLLNSLYGKFNQKNTYEEMRHFESLTDKEFLELSTKYLYSIVDEWVYFQINDKVPNFSHPIYSTYITSYARIHLHRLMKQAGTVLYVDTDSIMTTSSMTTDSALGCLKLEESCRRVVIVKPKMYAFGERFVKLKGVGRKMNIDIFNTILDGNSVEYMKFSKMKESIRRRMSFNKKMMVNKKIDLNDTKRQWKNKNFIYNVMEKSEARKI